MPYLIPHCERKWFPSPEVTTQPVTNTSIQPQLSGESMAQEMAQFLQDHVEQIRVARGDVEEEEAADILPPSEEEKDDHKPPLPIHVQITKEVAEKCTHFLSHSDTQLRIQALDTLRLALIPLHSQENVLLPLAHKIWPCLVKRLLQDEPLVLLRAFQMLVSLAALCKDFIRQRVCKDALPAFLTSLRSQALVSCHAGPVYSHTLGFKLQKALLDGLGTLCVDLALGDSDLLEVVDSCTLYLSARQPKQLQEAAVRTLLGVSQLDPDIVWLHLCQWQNPPEVPHSSLVPPSWTTKPHDEYTQNVCNLLQKLSVCHISSFLSSSWIKSVRYRYTKRLTNDHDQRYELAVIVGKSLCGRWELSHRLLSPATNDPGNDFGIVEIVFNDAEVPG
ncbi:unnamed protein product [Ranitomeya imitator]|uniref:TTI1 C-terminal TPR domain-containing protein n=1 Tax=Ranitomeya imitator TaxID=111125 RepID=A0ABN9KXV8_9NEOB|nr:unnamed protein product [Ranitomeya imitator]